MRDEQGGSPSGARASAAADWSRRSPRLRRGLLALLVTGITFTACRGSEKVASSLTPPDDNSEIDEADVPSALVVGPALISTPTYDGTGELVHPDAVVFPQRWNGHRYWVSATP